MGDTMGLVISRTATTPSKVEDASLGRAVRKIKKAVNWGQVRQFTGNDYAGLDGEGRRMGGFAWSGDMVQLHADHPDLNLLCRRTAG